MQILALKGDAGNADTAFNLKPLALPCDGSCGNRGKKILEIVRDVKTWHELVWKIGVVRLMLWVNYILGSYVLETWKCQWTLAKWIVEDLPELAVGIGSRRVREEATLKPCSGTSTGGSILIREARFHLWLARIIPCPHPWWRLVWRRERNWSGR